MTTSRPFLRAAALLAALAATAAPAQQAPAARLDTRLSAPAKNVVTVDRIVAVVNEEVITQNELAERTKLVIKQLQRGGGQVPPPEALQRQVLERMINDQVQLQMAKETGVKVDDAAVEKTIQRIADDNNLSMTAFRQALERDGIGYDRFRDDMRNELILARLREREVENTVVVTDAEVETELARVAKEHGADTEFHLQHILVLVPQQATPEQIEVKRRRALQALSELRKGATFAEVSATYSDAPDALQGGDLGWRPADRLPRLFLDALDKLRPGEVSDILSSPNGFHIVKLLEKRGQDKAPVVTQTHARHILLRAKEGVSDTDARERIARLRERIVAGDELRRTRAREFGRRDRLQGRRPGLDLSGRHGAGIRARHERAQGRGDQPARAVAVRLAHRAGARTPHRGDRATRAKQLAARQTLRERKADEAYQDWLRQLRDRAYVEYRLDER